MDNQDIEFEDMILKLQKIVKEIESDQINIDRAIQLFEEGNKLTQMAQNKINSIKKRVVKIVANKDSVDAQSKNEK